jgi:peptidyl-prolyl cis-trans isomerase D
MLAFFRRSQSSWFVLGLLGLILVSIIATGQFTNGAGGISGLAGGRNWIGRFGGTCAGSFCLGGNTVGADDLQNRMQGQLESARRKNPAMDMIQLIQQGGFEQTLEQLLSSRTLNYFADDQGMVVSKRSVDKQINEIGAFRGIGGTFDRDTFLRILAEKKLTEQGVRDDMASDANWRRRENADADCDSLCVAAA